MNNREKELIKEFNENLKKPYNLYLNLTSDDRGKEIENFLEILSDCVENIEVKKTLSDKLPSIVISDRLQYLGVPSDKELKPFLDEIILRSEKERNLPGNIKKRTDKIHDSVTIEIFVSSFCPTCPYTVEKIIPACDYSEHIKVKVIDTGLFNDLAAEKNIMSVPTVVVNEMRWTGEIDFSEIIDFITGLAPEELSPDALSRMLKDGEASEVSKMLLDKKQLFPSFLSLLTDEKWSTRLGAIVVMEEISEISRQLASHAVPFILENIKSSPDQIAGDLIYVAGLCGGTDIVSDLEKILKITDNEELKTAVKEAVSEIEQHFS